MYHLRITYESPKNHLRFKACKQVKALQPPEGGEEPHPALPRREGEVKGRKGKDEKGKGREEGRTGDSIALKWTKEDGRAGERGRQSRVQIRFGRNEQRKNTQRFAYVEKKL